MRSLFKPLTKRDAKIAAVVVGLVLIVLVISFVKDLLAGYTFDEVRSSALLIAFAGIIEWGMITIAFSKDKEDNKDEDGSDEDQKGAG